MSGRLGPRFGAEAAFLIAVAIVLGLLEVSWPAIVAGMFVAWLAVAAVELALARRPARPAAVPEAAAPPPAASAAETVRVVAEPAAGEPAIAPAAERTSEARAAPPEPAEPVPVPAAEPAATAEPEPEPGPAPEPEPEPEPEPVAAAEPEPAAEPVPPPPPVLTAVPPPAQEPPSEPEPEPEPAPSVVELRPGAPREWNLWELERLVRARSGDDPVRDEEWSYLLMYLREFATADGSLPRDFDGLVRESFGELVATAR